MAEHYITRIAAKHPERLGYPNAYTVRGLVWGDAGGTADLVIFPRTGKVRVAIVETKRSRADAFGGRNPEATRTWSANCSSTTPARSRWGPRASDKSSRNWSAAGEGTIRSLLSDSSSARATARQRTRSSRRDARCDLTKSGYTFFSTGQQSR